MMQLNFWLKHNILNSVSYCVSEGHGQNKLIISVCRCVHVIYTGNLAGEGVGCSSLCNKCSKDSGSIDGGGSIEGGSIKTPLTTGQHPGGEKGGAKQTEQMQLNSREELRPSLKAQKSRLKHSWGLLDFSFLQLLAQSGCEPCHYGWLEAVCELSSPSGTEVNCRFPGRGVLLQQGSPL